MFAKHMLITCLHILYLTIIKCDEQSNNNKTNREVQLADGSKVLGTISIDTKGGDFYSFKGIPYAEAPVNGLRFKPPIERKPWNGTRNAFTHGFCCPQNGNYTFCPKSSQNEDCLFVNVYTPKVNVTIERAAVIVYIHSGHFLVGSGNSEIFGPENLVREGVIVVTFNYRLGLLGWLKVNDERSGIAGNMGMKDQVLALRWVKKNIASFDGDPDRITLMGGASVHAHLLSPASRGLFERCIIQSDTAIYAAQSDYINTTRFSQVLNGSLQDFSELEALKIIKSAELSDLVAVPYKVAHEGDWSLGLSIESNLNEPFLTKSPLSIINAKEFTDVPCMIGYTNEEALSHLHRFNKFDQWFPSNKYAFGQLIGKQNISPLELSQYVKEIINFYFSDKRYTKLYNFLHMYMDMTTLMRIYDTIHLHLMESKSPIYVYRFSFDTGLNFVKNFRNLTGFSGAAHEDDLGYLFRTFNQPPIVPNSKEDRAQRIMTTLWTNFVKTGNPNARTSHFVWQSNVPNRTLTTLKLDFDWDNVDGFMERNRIQFWLDLRKNGLDGRYSTRAHAVWYSNIYFLSLVLAVGIALVVSVLKVVASCRYQQRGHYNYIRVGPV